MLKDILNNFKKVDQLKKKLDSQRPLTREIVENLHENLVLQWTYHSNAIEGNTLTLKETKVVFEGITVGGKTLREHFEAIGHKEAILYVEDIKDKCIGCGQCMISCWDGANQAISLDKDRYRRF